MCVPCGIWNFVWRTVCYKCGAPRGVSDDDRMKWEQSCSYPSTDADPSEVSSRAKTPIIARRVFFRTKFNIESSRNLTGVLDTVGLEKFADKQNFFILKFKISYYESHLYINFLFLRAIFKQPYRPRNVFNIIRRGDILPWSSLIRGQSCMIPGYIRQKWHMRSQEREPL
jgi:hypothetical protein